MCASGRVLISVTTNPACSPPSTTSTGTDKPCSLLSTHKCWDTALHAACAKYPVHSGHGWPGIITERERACYFTRVYRPMDVELSTATARRAVGTACGSRESGFTRKWLLLQKVPASPRSPHTQRLMSTNTHFMRIVMHHEANHSDDTCLCIPGSVIALFFDSHGFLVLPSCASTARGVHLPYRVECAAIAVKSNVCTCTSRETTGTRRCGLCTTLASGEC
jgi:hypothetical protein